MESARHEFVGRTVAGYAIDAWLGSGANAEIYLATHRHRQQTVALKLVAPRWRTDPRAVERFLREGELMASIDHPSVPRVWERGESRGLLYIAMTYADGRDLMQLLEREGPLPLARTLSLVEQLACVLDTLHAARLAHVDVKPTNILVGWDEHVYLTDFGRARRTSERKAVFEALDIAALANVAYRCLVGVPATELEALEENRCGMRPVACARSDVPASLDEVLAEATARPPTSRYPTAGELARALRLAAGRPEADAAGGRPRKSRLRQRLRLPHVRLSR
jgi:serine/threonine-protein kinase